MELAALVVTFNEERHLEECLQNLDSCAQLLVVDLGSRDHSIQIARKYATDLVQHEWAPIAEFVLPKVLDRLKLDWFIRVDPDEIVPKQLFSDIERCSAKNPKVGVVEIPFLYYFLGRPLTTTVWGGVRCFPKVMNKNRVIMPSGVHSVFATREGFSTEQIVPTRDNVVKHYWIDDMSQLHEKHRRYLALEGPSMFARGTRFSWPRLARGVVGGLWDSLILKNGWRGGWAGWYLSVFFARYVARSWLSLRRYQASVLAG